MSSTKRTIRLDNASEAALKRLRSKLGEKTDNKAIAWAIQHAVGLLERSEKAETLATHYRLRLDHMAAVVKHHMYSQNAMKDLLRWMQYDYKTDINEKHLPELDDIEAWIDEIEKAPEFTVRSPLF